MVIYIPNDKAVLLYRAIESLLEQKLSEQDKPIAANLVPMVDLKVRMDGEMEQAPFKLWLTRKTPGVI